MFYLSRVAVHGLTVLFTAGPDSLRPARHLLERAARHAGAVLMRELSASYPELDLRYEVIEILGADALTGGVEIRLTLAVLIAMHGP